MIGIDIPYYQVAAFAPCAFRGNPAGVCLLEEWLPDVTLQDIAAENNLSDTAFVLRRGSDYDLRWFTPTVELDLCGHATLASAHVLFQHVRAIRGTEVSFSTRSGVVSVSRVADRLVLDFPARPPTRCETPDARLPQALGASPRIIYRSRDYLAVFEKEEEIAALQPDLALLNKIGAVIATAPGSECDFVSRYFAPNHGIPEDPVTGSAHCALVPYWSDCLGKQTLYARQISRRGGELFCENRGDRVKIGGSAVTYLIGKMRVPQGSVGY